MEAAAEAKTPHLGAEQVAAKLFQHMMGTRQMFLSEYGNMPPLDPTSQSKKLSIKLADEYGNVSLAPQVPVFGSGPEASALLTAGTPAPVGLLMAPKSEAKETASETESTEATTILAGSDNVESLIDKLPGAQSGPSTALAEYKAPPDLPEKYHAMRTELIIRQREKRLAMPEWHRPWKTYRVIQGHLGWVRAVAVDSSNEWFATGSADRTIRIYDLASGTLKLTLTGHINSVMGLAVSDRHPYLFSVGMDKMVKCWDLEQNKVVRSYHGHLSGVYSVGVHPTLDLLVTGGRDSVARVWDMRTKAEVRVLTGHKDTVGSMILQPTDPQVITSSHDSTVKLWDIIDGRAITTLTNHKKAVRAMCAHPTEYTFASGSADNIKVWKLPQGEFLRNHSGHNAIINCMSVNRDGVMFSGADNGSIKFWDWKTGYNFQSTEAVVQPGSLEAEAGIFASTFDVTGSRLITCEADKSIKMWKEDDTATPESHPIDYRPTKKRKHY